MRESDYIIHLGDLRTDLTLLDAESYNKLYSVLGNCDGGGDDAVISIEDVKILLTHGDKYGVKNSLTRLYFKAKEQKVNAVFFGHTHNAVIEENEGITFINPGTMTKFSQKSYCYIVVSGNKITAKTVYFD
jgi:putative phosphoesterase